MTEYVLLDCPFCGSKGDTKWRFNKLHNKQLWTASCSNPACFMYEGIFWMTDKEEAIRRWNTRAKED